MTEGNGNHLVPGETVTLSQASLEAAAGNMTTELDPQAGVWKFTTERGTVLAWMFLRIQNLQLQVESQAGSMFAAGNEIQRLREHLKNQEPRSPLIIPNVVFDPPPPGAGGQS